MDAKPPALRTLALRTALAVCSAGVWAVGWTDAAWAQRQETLTTYYPAPYGDYRDLQVNQSVTVGQSSTTASVSSVKGTMQVINGGLTISSMDAGGLVRVAPLAGPYGADALLLNPAASCASIGVRFFSPTCSASSSKLRVHTAVRAQRLYALSAATAPGGPVYAYAEAQANGAPCTLGNVLNTDGHLQGFLGVKRLIGGVPNETTDPFARLSIDARFIELGDWPRPGRANSCFPNPTTPFKWCWTRYLANEPVGNLDLQGDTIDGILIGTDAPVHCDPVPPLGQPCLPENIVLLQVGTSTDGAILFVSGGFAPWPSSRRLKTGIAPLRRADYAGLLAKTVAMNIVRFHYKDEPPERKLRIGFINEELPKDILWEGQRSLALNDEVIFLAGALKELKMKNDALKRRVAALERQQRRLSRAGGRHHDR